MSDLSLRDGTAEVCARVKEVLKALPPPEGDSRKAFFALRNLWRVEIKSACEQIIEYYESIEILTDQGRSGPAAALSRSVHEACFRLEYLCLNKCELPDWMEWQINRLYHFVSEVLQFENTINPTGKRNFQAQKNELRALLGKPPKRRGFPWRNLDCILSNISSGMPSGHDKRLRRLLFDYPSAFVHLGAIGAPVTDYSVEAARSALLLSVELAMKLCRDEQLVPNELSTEVDAIATMCDHLRQIETGDN